MFKKLALSALLIAGCGATAPAPQPTPQIVYVTPAPTPVPMPTLVPTAVPTPVPTPEPTDPPIIIDLPNVEGDAAVEFVGDEPDECTVDVRVIKVVKWTYDSYFIDPDRGNRFITVDVSVKGILGTCPDTEVGYLAFTLGDPEGYTYDSEPAWRDPQLPYGSDMNMKPGRTYRGWITFQYPKTLTSGSVFFGTDGEWRFTL